MPPIKIKVVDVINDAYDIPKGDVPHDVKSIEDIPEPIEEQTPVVQEPQPVEEEVTQPLGLVQEQPVSNIKTVELVECPDCNKKLTKKSSKYSHAENCPANKQPKEEEKEEETNKEDEEEEAKEAEADEEEVKPSPLPY